MERKEIVSLDENPVEGAWIVKLASMVGQGNEISPKEACRGSLEREVNQKRQHLPPHLNIKCQLGNARCQMLKNNE